MKLFFKVFALFAVFAALFMLGFELWGEPLERLFNQQECSRWFAEIRPYAWAIGIGLLVADLFLPIPATGIMAALGSVYGLLAGALISIVGSAGAGITGYVLARLVGIRVTRFMVSEQEIKRFNALFNAWGGFGIIISRIMPILPEVMTILAGFAKMTFGRFLAALLMGTIPTCFLFSYLGHVSRNDPGYGVIVAVIIPLVIWPLFLKFAFVREETAA